MNCEGVDVMKYYQKPPHTFRTSTDGISLGDHLCTLGSDRNRHGIYAGSCQVVCYAGGVIAQVPLDTFAGGSEIVVSLDKSEYTAAEIVRRAKSMLESGLEFEFISGDHFCKWCRRGLLPVE